MRMLKTTSLLMALTPLISHAKTLPWEGLWKLNLEESEAVSETYEEGSGAGRAKIFQNASISIMGLPLPSRSRGAPRSGLAPKNPAVLLATEMAIVTDEKVVTLTYDAANDEKIHKGHYRGRDAKWDKKRLTQKYKTPDRTVTKTWRVRDDGRLLVEVKLNPRKERARYYRRVYDRITATTATKASEEPKTTSPSTSDPASNPASALSAEPTS